MKALSVFRRMLRQGRVRFLLLLLVSIYSGYMVVSQSFSFQLYNTVAGFWDTPSMEDCLVMEYKGKAIANSYGYNSNGLQTLEEIKNIDGIADVYTTLMGSLSNSIEDNWQFYSVLAFSQAWLEKSQHLLSSGALELYDPQAGYIPAIVSDSMRPYVQLGDILEGDYHALFDFADPEKGEIVTSSSIRLKITGFLPSSGAYPNYYDGSTISSCSPRNMTRNWYASSYADGHAEMDIFIPQEALYSDPHYELYQYSVGPLMLLQLDASMVGNEAGVRALIRQLSERGIGNAATGKHLGELVRNTEEARTTNIINVSILTLFLLLEAFSVITFQTAFIHERRRMMATTHLLGIPWRSIGAGWMLLCVLFGALPTLAGMCYATWKKTNHMVVLPITLWYYLLPLGLMALFGGIVFATLRRFARVDPILLLHED